MGTIPTRSAPILTGLALAVGITSVAAADGPGTFGNRSPWLRSAQGGTTDPTQQTPTQQTPTEQAPPPSK